MFLDKGLFYYMVTCLEDFHFFFCLEWVGTELAVYLILGISVSVEESRRATCHTVTSR